MDELVIIFEDLIRLIRKRSYSNFALRSVNVMIPAMRDRKTKIIFKDGKNPVYYDANETNEIIFEGDCRTMYHITHHIIKSGEVVDDIDYDTLRHIMHYAEYCIGENMIKSEYIKVYMEI